MNRREAFERARNANRGNLIRTDWLTALSRATKRPIGKESLLPLEETIELRRRFFDTLRSKLDARETMFFPKNSVEELVAYLSSTSASIGGLTGVLFSSVDNSIGAVILPAECVLCDAFDVWEVVEEDLCMTTNDLRHGMCLERALYDASGNYMKEGLFELNVWGAFRPTT